MTKHTYDELRAAEFYWQTRLAKTGYSPYTPMALYSSWYDKLCWYVRESPGHSVIGTFEQASTPFLESRYGIHVQAAKQCFGYRSLPGGQYRIDHV